MPAEYAPKSTPPCTMSFFDDAIANMEASMGERHGVQPNANAAPTTSATPTLACSGLLVFFNKILLK